MYILGKNPDIQEKLYQEVKSVIDNEGQFDSDGVQRMPYLRGLIKESQRYISHLDYEITTANKLKNYFNFSPSLGFIRLFKGYREY